MRVRSLFPVTLLALVVACHHHQANDATTLQASADGKTLTLARSGVTLLTFPSDAFQLGIVDTLDDSASYDPYWEAVSTSSPTGVVWKAITGAKVLSQTATDLKIELDYTGASAILTTHVEAPGRFSASLTPENTDGLATAYIRLRPRAGATEGFYGLGEWGDSVNHRGKLRPMQLEANLDMEGGDNEAHAPIPLLIGTNGWGLFVESRRPGLFDVTTKDATTVEVTFGTAGDSGAGLKFHLFSAAHPLDITKFYYDVTGAPRLPAPWALGPWVWRNEVRDQAQALDDIAQINGQDLPVSGYWLDRPYATGVQTFDYDPLKFHDPQGMISALRANGLRVAVWHAPYVAPAGTGEASPTYSQEAATKGYFPPTSGLSLNHWSSPIDFTNPEACAWWQGLLHKYTDTGVEGYKLDYGEDVQVGVGGARDTWKFADGSDERTMHYGYTRLYHRIYAETLPKEGGFLLCRTARWGDQATSAIVWPGDLDASFAHEGDLLPGGKKAVGGLLPSLIKGLGLAPSGFPFYASDTAGYRGDTPTKELWIRWIEANALGSALEVGDGANEVPWATLKEDGKAPKVVDVFRAYGRLHMRLFPYKWTYAQNLSKDGRAITRPFGLAYPSLGKHPNDEFLLGDSILVAPVLEAAQTTRHLILPPGNWVSWWDGKSYAGDAQTAVEIDLPAPINLLPLFIKEGGIVPMLRPNIRTLAPTTRTPPVESYADNPGVLYARVAPSTTASSFDVFDGARLTQQKSASGVDLGFTEGTTPTFASGAIFEVIATPKPSMVTNHGQALTQRGSADELASAPDGWSWDARVGGTLWVRVPRGQAAVSAR
jgi:alpha-D-xyloside xylohydrolase